MTPKRNSAFLSRRGLLGAIAATPLVSLAAGCSSLVPGQGPPPDLYRLQTKPQFPADMPQVDWQLQIPAPTAPAGLDTTRIALLHNPARIEYYARSDWMDRAPLLVQAMMIQAFESSGRILSVGEGSANARTDYVLTTDLRDFQAEYFMGPLPEVHVGVTAKLVSLKRRAIVALRKFDDGATAKADRIEDVVGAFAEALSKVLSDLVPWTLTTGEADRKAA